MALGQILAGNIIYADDIQDELDNLAPITITKLADETVSNSTTLQNDDELLLAVTAGTVYDFEAEIIYGAGTTADFKAAWTFPTATFNYTAVNLDTAGTAGETVSLGEASGSAKSFGGVGVGSFRFIRYKGRLTVGVSGTLRLQWAQNALVVENTVVKAGSWITLRVVS